MSSCVVLTLGPAAVLGQDARAADITIYDPNPDHLWNRLHAVLFVRLGPDGNTYGEDRLEPLLWVQSDHLLRGEAADRVLAVLDEFLRNAGESLVEDPLKRAVLQRDLWLVASWAAASDRDMAAPLLRRLAGAVRRLALTSDRIAALPDNYAQAVAAGRFPGRFDPARPERGFLPPDLLRGDGPWVCVGREDGPSAPQHLRSDHPFTNSAFLVFLRLPGGREATLDFLGRLAAFSEPLYLPNPDERTNRSYPSLPNPALPQWPRGTEVALVRRALLIDAEGRIVPSPLTESVQVRVLRVDTPELTGEALAELDRSLPGQVVNGYGPDMPPEERARHGRAAPDAQAFFEFRLGRAALFARGAGGLRDATGERDLDTGFNAHAWDELEGREPFGTQAPSAERVVRAQRVVGATCIGCHRFPGVYGFNSFHGDFPFGIRRDVGGDADDGLYAPRTHALSATTVERAERAAARWKREQAGWEALSKLLSE